MITVTIVIEILCSSFQVSQTELIKNGRSFSSSGQTGNSSITTLNKDETAATFLPASLFQSITKHDNIGSFYAVYNTAVLFPIAQTDQEMNTSVTTVVGSPVLAATIGLQQNFSELTEPVRILLRLNNLGVSDSVAYLASFPGPTQLSIALLLSFHSHRGRAWKQSYCPPFCKKVNLLATIVIETCILFCAECNKWTASVRLLGFWS